jgi:hypothetical protein
MAILFVRKAILSQKKGDMSQKKVKERHITQVVLKSQNLPALQHYIYNYSYIQYTISHYTKLYKTNILL